MKLKNVRLKDLRRGQELFVIRNNEHVDTLYVTANSPKYSGFEVYSHSKGILMWLPYEEADFEILFREVWSL